MLTQLRYRPDAQTDRQMAFQLYIVDDATLNVEQAKGPKNVSTE